MRILFKALVATLLSGASVHAESLASMQGAWVEEEFNCADTFEVKGGKVVYKNRGGSLDTGIIFSGNRIEGPTATCTANRTKEGKDGITTVLMSCATNVMSAGMATKFRMIDSTHFEHFDDEFPEMTTRYQRCNF